MGAVFLKIDKTAIGIFKDASGIGVLFQPCDQQSGSLSVVVTDFFSMRVCVRERERERTLKLQVKLWLVWDWSYLQKYYYNSVKI